MTVLEEKFFDDLAKWEQSMDRQMRLVQAFKEHGVTVPDDVKYELSRTFDEVADRLRELEKLNLIRDYNDYRRRIDIY